MPPICTWCGSDVDVTDHDPAHDIALCEGPGHPGPRMFHPAAEAAARSAANRLASLPVGMAAELELWTNLPAELNPGEWADTNVVEHRYATAHPEDYDRMLRRWGHVAQGPRKYSVTSYLGSTLGHLTREGSVAYKAGQGSGRFAYNSTIGFWTTTPIPPDTTDLGWADYARALGLDPDSWPLV